MNEAIQWNLENVKIFTNSKKKKKKNSVMWRIKFLNKFKNVSFTKEQIEVPSTPKFVNINL